VEALGKASDWDAMPDGISGLACGADMNAQAAVNAAVAATNKLILRMVVPFCGRRIAFDW
jgi:hypothetical protein